MKIGYCDPSAFNALLFLRREHRIGWRAFGLGMVIASFADKDAGEAWPSRATLSAITGIKETDISSVVRELRDAGFMTIAVREGRSNVYHLTHPHLATGSNLLPIPEQRPTHPHLALKPIPEQRPITIKEQYKNNDLPQNNEKPLSCSAPTGDQEATNVPKVTPKKPKVAMADMGFVVPDAIRRAWATAYPGVDIDREAAKAFAWCKSNPRKAPKKDYGRFLNSWLGRAEPSGSPTTLQDDDSIGYLLHKLDHVEAKYGEDVARRYDAKAREFNSTIKADEWLKREIECRTV